MGGKFGEELLGDYPGLLRKQEVLARVAVQLGGVGGKKTLREK